MMAYTDIQLRAFTQIAYMDLEAGFEKYSINGAPVSLSKLLSNHEKSKLISLGIKEEEINTWKISAVHDTNKTNGFYACVVETAPGVASVAFRGSEGMDEMSSLKNDWIDADLGLLNSTCTNQQAEAERFLLKNQDLLNRYGDLTMTGHSLGGNLAEYATIVSCKYGLDDNISRCVSLDGPGFSDEFIKTYYQEIALMKDRIKHYRWSLVGTMLNDLPGVEYKYLSVSNEANVLDDESYTAITRHDTKYLDYDPETGMFTSGFLDDLSAFTSRLTKTIDHVPPVLGDSLLTIVSGTLISVMWAKENVFDECKIITPTGHAIIDSIATITAKLITAEIILTEIVVSIVASVATIVAAMTYELFIEPIITVIDAICDALKEIYNWAKNVVNQLREAAISLIENIKIWWKKNFDNGYKYAESHPQMRLDTYKLRSYAQRLQDVNHRLNNLDGRMDNLYRSLNLFDKWKLMKADLLTGEDRNLKKCINYLNDTADEFDSVESNLIASL